MLQDGNLLHFEKNESIPGQTRIIYNRGALLLKLVANLHCMLKHRVLTTHLHLITDIAALTSLVVKHKLYLLIDLFYIVNKQITTCT